MVSIQKVKAIILYFCQNTDLRFLGKVKLMKLFYFLDFVHFKRYGVSVTGDFYVNLEHGPIPSAIMNLVNEAINNPDESYLADIIGFERTDSGMCRVIPLKNFSEVDRGYFSESEQEIMDFVCEKFKHSNKREIEELSHIEAPWKKTNRLERIPYELALSDVDCVVDQETIDLLSKIG